MAKKKVTKRVAKKGVKTLTPENPPIPHSDPFLTKLTETARKNNLIKPSEYQKWVVMRGLRTPAGAGVLAGLTEIGDVHGFVVDEQVKVPVEGRLCYRGYDVKNLVSGCQRDKRFGFEEACYLLLFGSLPTSTQLEGFTALIDETRTLPTGFTENMILDNPSRDIMNKLARCILVLYSFDKKAEDRSLKNILRQCICLISRFPTLAAYGYQAKAHYYDNQSLFIHKPEPGKSTAENLLMMTRPDQQYTQTEAELLDLSLILHAEHGGGNNSSFTAHVVSSSDTDTYSAIAAAIGSLKGAKHGGANIKVRRMMENIKQHVKNWDDENEVTAYLAKIIKRKAFDKSGLIYGIGHAVYTLSDPRAVLLKKKAEKLAKEKDRLAEFKLYSLIERLAPLVFADVKKSDKVVAANVDFYSGFVYNMLGIPSSMFTPIFAVARIAGWSAHLLEERVSGGRIYRPAYKNVIRQKKYARISER
jgi:citrate synthase